MPLLLSTLGHPFPGHHPEPRVEEVERAPALVASWGSGGCWAVIESRGLEKQRPMAFPGLIRGIFFFFLNPGNKSIWSAIVSQALYPSKVVNVVGFLASEDWEGGRRGIGLGFSAEAQSRIWGLQGSCSPIPPVRPPQLPLQILAGSLHPTTHASLPISPRPFLQPNALSSSQLFFPACPAQACHLPSVFAALQLPEAMCTALCLSAVLQV